MNGEMNQQVNSEVLRYLEVKESKRLTSQRPESFTNMKHRIFKSLNQIKSNSWFINMEDHNLRLK